MQHCDSGHLSHFHCINVTCVIIVLCSCLLLCLLLRSSPVMTLKCVKIVEDHLWLVCVCAYVLIVVWHYGELHCCSYRSQVLSCGILANWLCLNFFVKFDYDCEMG